MAAVALAPLRRRALERKGMTPEEELDLLVREQEADDTFFVRRPSGDISYDGPAPGLEGPVSDYVGVDLDGHLVSFLPRSDESMFSVVIPHGSFNGYNNHKCRCHKCRGFIAAYRRGKRSQS